MKWSLRIGRFSGIDVRMHITFLLLIGLVALMHWRQGLSIAAALAGVIFILAVFLCVVLHEFGHAFDFAFVGGRHLGPDLARRQAGQHPVLGFQHLGALHVEHLAGLLGDRRLVMAMVDAVPAGIYGKAALTSLGLWEKVRGKVKASLRNMAPSRPRGGSGPRPPAAKQMPMSRVVQKPPSVARRPESAGSRTARSTPPSPWASRWR